MLYIIWNSLPPIPIFFLHSNLTHPLHKMADPLSISASIAGLITIADIVVRRGYKYLSAVRDADEAVANLVKETNILYGTLQSLRNIAEGLEMGNTAFVSTTRVNHVDACYKTLQKITKILDAFEPSATTGSVQHFKNRFKWPLAHSESKDLLEEVRGHREVLSLAMNADELSALIQLLARQDVHGDDLSAVKKGLEEDRLYRKRVEMNQKELEMLDWLCLPDVDPGKAQKSAVCLRQAGTGVWFLDGDSFQEWQLSNNSALWVHGIPGAGKTILMSTIIQEIERKLGHNEGFAYFYCDYKDPNTHQPNFILGSLIKQFVLQKAEVMQISMEFYEKHRQLAGRYGSPDLESLLKQLHKVMEVFSTATVVIDGLDEIAGDRWDTIDLIQRIRQKDSRTRTLYASRKETDIETCLTEYQKVSIAAQSSDLALYVASEVDKRTRKRQLSIKDPDLKETILNRLVNGAEGMFRWVACQIDHLCELPNDKARAKALDCLPRGLPKTYERILCRVLERHIEIHAFVARTFQWLAFSKDDISSEAFLIAISINPEDRCLDPSTIPSEDDLLTWGSSLIRRRADGDGVEFAHFTVKEYLLSIATTNEPHISKFALYENEANLNIGHACLNYLLSDGLGEAPPSDDIFALVSEGIQDEFRPFKLFENQLINHPLCSYATDNCFKHLHGHLENGEIMALTHKLFCPEKSNNFLWFCYTLLSIEADWDWQAPFTDTTTLHWAALLALDEVSSWLIDQGCDVNRKSIAGTPLKCALQGLSALTYLDSKEVYECGPNDNPEVPEGFAIAKRLIRAGADPSRRSSSDSEFSAVVLALHYNCRDNELLHQLCGGGSRIDELTLRELEIYTSKGPSDDSIDALVDLFTSLSFQEVPENYKERFLELSRQLDTVTSVVTQQSKNEENDKMPKSSLKVSEAIFLQAAEHGIETEIVSFVSSIEDLVNEKEELRIILAEGLKLVLQHGHDSCLEHLLSRGADPNILDDDGDTALHVAVEEENNFDDDSVIKNVKTLLEYGADFTVQNESGETPLHVAARNSEHKQILRHLHPIIDSESFQFSLFSSKPSLLLCATESGSDDNIKFLSEQYECFDLFPRIFGAENTLLGLAALRRTAFAMDLLLKKGLSTKTLNTDGTSILYNATTSGHKEVFDYLIGLGTIDTSSKLDGWKAIHEAAKGGSTAKLDALLLTGENPNTQTADGSSALHLSTESSLCTQLLCSQDQINVNIKDNRGLTPLMVFSEAFTKSLHSETPAFHREYRESIMLSIGFLLDRKSDASLTDNRGMTALHHLLQPECGKIRMQENYFNVLRLIVASGGNLASRCDMNKRPFDYLLEACANLTRFSYHHNKDDFEAILKFVISNIPRESLNEFCGNGMTPLVFAIDERNMTMVELLLACQEVDVDIKDQHSRLTALEIAAKNGCTRVIAKTLLARTRYSVQALNRIHGFNLLHYAVHENKAQTMLKLLLETQAVDLRSPTRDGRTPLQLAIMAENIAAIGLLVEAGVDLQTPFENRGIYPLHLASEAGLLPVVRKLVDLGANVNTTSWRWEATPLHFAADSKTAAWDTVLYLIEKGADVNALDVNSYTPYIAAARANRWDIVQEYLKIYNNLDGKPIDGRDLLYWSIHHGQNTILKSLQQRGKDLKYEIRDEENKLLENTLSVAVRTCNEEAFVMLWDESNLNFTSDNGWTLAHFAMLPEKNEVRNQLLKQNISWNLQIATTQVEGTIRGELATIRGLTPLHIAALHGCDPAITFLSDEKLISDFNTGTLSPDHYSALHLTTFWNESRTVKLLHKYGADLDLVDGIDHQTALHHAAKRGFHETVTALLEAGCKPNELDIHGMTPELLAIERGHHAVIEILGRHLDALEAKKIANQDDSPGSPLTGSHSPSTDDNSSVKSFSSDSSGTSTNTTALSTIPKRLWRLPLHQGPDIRKIMTEDLSIYAINEKDCPEELRKMLEENEGKHVESLGKPFRRRI
ncbi:hypothetical protein HYFRA_00011572 [Hymenoscyphus fraxineus]|uniref:Nephrocystin 3-like N-terminal domain-containing protein n=1 Tax=Hymenoscyphus fraxineus TaxID=746836 RepID=A0A9N9PLR2_9HELO|nr:hypothetical protein HYFRA_00011572 [Hymenoscyphus fraxineus]